MTERELLKTLKATDPAARNAAAIALADLGSHRGVAAIKGLLRDSVTAGARGSLLYALREANAKLELGELVGLMLTDAPEAREEAFSFLEDGLVERASEAEYQQAVDRLRRASNEGQDEDVRAIARDALDLLAG